MITIVAKNYVKPDQTDAFRAAAAPLIAASNAEEGCISYALYTDINNPNILTFIEQWQSAEAVALHNASAHFTAIVPALAQFYEKDSEVHLYKKL